MTVKAIVIIARNGLTHSFHIEGQSKYEVNRQLNTYIRNMRDTGLLTNDDQLIVEWPHD
jgi:hypothetical protein